MISNEEKKLKKYLSDLSKERLIDLYLQKDFADKIELGIMKTRISDLETKLAQSKMNESFEKEKKDNAFKLIEELKQQLTEKDKEIERMSVSSDWQSLLILKQELEIIEKENKVLKERSKDKISFAVEQLEKVKEFNIQQVFSSKPLDDFIDNQIKQLKEIK